MMALGTLYIVATPLGNLEDFTYRGVKVLSTVALIAAENIHHTSILLRHYGISTPCMAYHAHNEMSAVKSLLKRLISGESVALVSDAGTPLISDPGYKLVEQARQQHIPVVPIPGPCAAIAALSVSGLSTHGFLFLGFLSSKEGSKMEQLRKVAHSKVPLVIYEAPHRLKSTLYLLQGIMGESRTLVLAKEITKRYEQFVTGTPAYCLFWLEEDPQRLRGEWVILVADEKDSMLNKEVSEEGRRVLSVLIEHMPLKQAAHITAKLAEDNKNALYEWALTQKDLS